jgi:hypothetical protein
MSAFLDAEFLVVESPVPANRDIQARAIALYPREHPVMETSAILSPECCALCGQARFMDLEQMDHSDCQTISMLLALYPNAGGGVSR